MTSFKLSFKLIATALAMLGIIATIFFLTKENPSAHAENSESRVSKGTSVRLDTARVKGSRETLSLIGTVQAKHEVAVISETQGRVVKVFVEVGDQVRAGSTLVKIDAALKAATLSAASANYEKAKKDLDRFNKLLAEKNASETDVETARLTFKSAEAQYLIAKRELENASLTSPISGVVADRSVGFGTMVQPGSPVATVVDLSALKITVPVSEHDVFALRTGDTATVFTDAYPEVRFTARVKSIGSKGDAARAYPVELTMDNSPTHPLKAGQSARITFSISHAAALRIPRAALLGSVLSPVVFVAENGIARKRTLTVGKEHGTDIDVLTGLSAGDAVIVAGQFFLQDGAAIQTASPHPSPQVERVSRRDG